MVNSGEGQISTLVGCFDAALRLHCFVGLGLVRLPSLGGILGNWSEQRASFRTTIDADDKIFNQI